MKTLRARFVLPLASPPIADGGVCLDGHRIVAVGRFDEVRQGAVEDLGEVVLLPGLINAHCHLDYSNMRNAILFAPSFAQWVRRLNELKRIQSDDDYLSAIASGFRELQSWGTTSVFNIESFPELMVRMPPPPLRTWWFYELLDIRSRVHTEDVVAGALAFFDERPKWIGGYGLSPHAPYTTSAKLYELSRICCEKYGMSLMTHLAETPEEFEMFSQSSGVLYDFLAPLGRDMSDTGRTTPVQHLLQKKLLPYGAILTHMNVLSEEDWAMLESHRDRFTVVHCPNCHAYFERDSFDLERFRRIGINLCLGTDSLASNRALNLFSEMQTIQAQHPTLPASEILDMVTRNAARAIGLAGKLGEITPGALADMIALPFDGTVGEVMEAVVAHAQPIEWLMVNGRRLSL